VLLVQLGHRTVNLEYMILAEDSKGEPPPKAIPLGSIRLSIEGGRTLDVTGDHAEKLRGKLAELLSPQVEEETIAIHGKVVARRSSRKE
jgi:hypothetical protein